MSLEDELARCEREIERCVVDCMEKVDPAGAYLGLQDWMGERILLRKEIMREEMQRFVEDAKRTEPDYMMALHRLKDPRTVRLLHAAIGMATEAGEFLDMLKKHIFYGKPIDMVNAVEEIGDSTWYERIGCDALETSYLDMLQRNVDKLKARFPDKFKESDATNRNLDKERKILEGNPFTCARCGTSGSEYNAVGWFLNNPTWISYPRALLCGSCLKDVNPDLHKMVTGR